MKIDALRHSNRRRAFEIDTERGTFSYPYDRAEPPPTPHDPIAEIYIDRELAYEGLTYFLASGAEGSLLVDQFLDYNGEPAYLRDLLLHKMTVEAQDAMKRSPLSKREVIRRLRTSPAQFYRLMDQTNYTKSIDAMVELLQVLGCDVEFVVRDRKSA